MRINKYLAQSTGISRRMADKAVAAGRVTINDNPAEAGSAANDNDTVKLDGHTITPVTETITIIFHKPVGCVVSREGQGSLIPIIKACWSLGQKHFWFAATNK